ncbi:hypothetical protein [Cupriavidus basilensis]|uniref:hypothetical protein n=1 Tax=Cupriavidus basilensis TaxID=68895 RepID=UPI0039F70344
MVALAMTGQRMGLAPTDSKHLMVDGRAPFFSDMLRAFALLAAEQPREDKHESTAAARDVLAERRKNALDYTFFPELSLGSWRRALQKRELPSHRKH